MKKLKVSLIFLNILLSLLSFMYVPHMTPQDLKAAVYTVSFDANGGSVAAPVPVGADGNIAVSPESAKKGYMIAGRFENALWKAKTADGKSVSDILYVIIRNDVLTMFITYAE